MCGLEPVGVYMPACLGGWTQVVESMFSIRTAYEITGAVDMYDRVERIAFNALPATTDQLFAGNAYYHSVNQLEISGKYGYEINGCCTGNVHQGWPKFIMSQVQTKHGDPSALVISGYAPHSAMLADGTTVQVGGQYPYADNVTIAIKRTAGQVRANAENTSHVKRSAALSSWGL